MPKKLIFLCGARDFHAMDWYRSALELIPNTPISIVTDLIAGENFKKIINDKDQVHRLFVLDKFLFRNQSSLGDKWRNILKLLVLPIQVLLLKKFARKNPNAIYHAHSMYYLVLARAARVKYIGTPQGSDILVKPKKSRFYNWFSKYGLEKAKHITVDSLNMQQGVMDLVGKKAVVIQNGIDMARISETLDTLSIVKDSGFRRSGILSIRGFTELYRIKELILNRNLIVDKVPISFIYPFHEDTYRSECKILMSDTDLDLGRVERISMYELLTKAQLVVSIPSSDSSPRSVYEAIFCGCPVAIDYNPYYDTLPACMKKRVVLVNLDEGNWLEKAIQKSNEILISKYEPSAEAIEIFDQRKSFLKLEKLLFES